MPGGLSSALAGLSAVYPGYLKGREQETQADLGDLKLKQEKSDALGTVLLRYGLENMWGGGQQQPQPSPQGPTSMPQPGPQGGPPMAPQPMPPQPMPQQGLQQAMLGSGQMPMPTGMPPGGGGLPPGVGPTSSLDADRYAQANPPRFANPSGGPSLPQPPQAVGPGGQISGPAPYGYGPNTPGGERSIGGMPGGQAGPRPMGPPGGGMQGPGGQQGAIDPRGRVSLQALYQSLQKAAMQHPELSDPGAMLSALTKMQHLLAPEDKMQLMMAQLDFKQQQLDQKGDLAAQNDQLRRDIEELRSGDRQRGQDKAGERVDKTQKGAMDRTVYTQEEIDARQDKGIQAKKDLAGEKGPTATQIRTTNQAQKYDVVGETIDDTLADIQTAYKSGLSATGLGGKVRSIAEIARTMTGMSDKTIANRFAQKINILRTEIPGLLRGSSITSKEDRERITQIVKGLEPGSTTSITVDDLKYLKTHLERLKPKAGVIKDKEQAEPKPGDVKKGYRFKGGDPSQQESWEKVSRTMTDEDPDPIRPGAKYAAMDDPSGIGKRNPNPSRIPAEGGGGGATIIPPSSPAVKQAIDRLKAWLPINERNGPNEAIRKNIAILERGGSMAEAMAKHTLKIWDEPPTGMRLNPPTIEHE